MKRALFIFGAPVLGIVLISSVLRTSGSPGGYSGSPGDGKNCTNCHSGSASNQSDWITSDIPSSGYMPGHTYTITGSMTHSGMSTAGFEITCESVGNDKEGTYTITNSSETKIINSTAVTHTSNGVNPSGSSKSWSFSWTAPITGTGTVTFYGSFLAGNGGSSSGDITYLSSLSVNEDTSTGIENDNSGAPTLVYLSQSKELLYTSDQPAFIQIHALNGQLIRTIPVVANQSQLSSGRLFIGNLQKGYYIVSLLDNHKPVTQIKIIVQ